MAKYRLFASKRAGSMIVELAFAQCGVAPRVIDIDYSKVAGRRERRLLSRNPLSRLPTVILPDGEILTESGAIILHLVSRFPESGLAPKPSSREYARFLRLLFILTGELYPCFTFGDDPSEWVRAKSSRSAYLAAVDRHRKEVWAEVDRLLARRGPWALGSRVSALDFYLTVMSHWSPGRSWVHRRFPRIARISRGVRDAPRFAGVLQRNEVESIWGP